MFFFNNKNYFIKNLIIDVCKYVRINIINCNISKFVELINYQAVANILELSMILPYIMYL